MDDKNEEEGLQKRSDGNLEEISADHQREDESPFGFALKEFHKNRHVIIRDVPPVTYQEVKDFLTGYGVSNISISRKCRHAIVTLLNGMDADSIVEGLNGQQLLGVTVQVDLYPSDSLLCVVHLPFNLDDTDFRSVVEEFGATEKCFLMRNREGRSKGYGFVEFVHNKEKCGEVQKMMDGMRQGSCVLHVDFLEPSLLTFEHLHSRCLLVNHLPPQYSNREEFEKIFSEHVAPTSSKLYTEAGPGAGFGVVEFNTWQEAEETQKVTNGRMLAHFKIRVTFCIPGQTANSVFARLAKQASAARPGLLPMPATPKFQQIPPKSKLASPMVKSLLSNSPRVMSYFQQVLGQLQDQMTQHQAQSMMGGPMNALLNPNLQIALLAVLLTVQLQEAQPSLMANPILQEMLLANLRQQQQQQPQQQQPGTFNTASHTKPSLLGNPLIAQANSMLQSLMSQPTASTGSQSAAPQQPPSQPAPAQASLPQPPLFSQLPNQGFNPILLANMNHLLNAAQGAGDSGATKPDNTANQKPGLLGNAPPPLRQGLLGNCPVPGSATDEAKTTGLLGNAPGERSEKHGLLGSKPGDSDNGSLGSATGLMGSAPGETTGKGLLGNAPGDATSKGLLGNAPGDTIAGASKGLLGSAPGDTTNVVADGRVTQGLLGNAPGKTSKGLLGNAPGDATNMLVDDGVTKGLLGSAPGDNPSGISQGLLGSAPGGNPSSMSKGLLGSAPGDNPSGMGKGLLGSAPGDNPSGMSKGLLGSAPGGINKGLLGNAPGDATNLVADCGLTKGLLGNTANLVADTGINKGLLGNAPATNSKSTGLLGNAPTASSTGLLGNAPRDNSISSSDAAKPASVKQISTGHPFFDLPSVSLANPLLAAYIEGQMRSQLDLSRGPQMTGHNSVNPHGKAPGPGGAQHYAGQQNGAGRKTGLLGHCPPPSHQSWNQWSSGAVPERRTLNFEEEPSSTGQSSSQTSGQAAERKSLLGNAPPGYHESSQQTSAISEGSASHESQYSYGYDPQQWYQHMYAMYNQDLNASYSSTGSESGYSTTTNNESMYSQQSDATSYSSYGDTGSANQKSQMAAANQIPGTANGSTAAANQNAEAAAAWSQYFASQGQGNDAYMYQQMYSQYMSQYAGMYQQPATAMDESSSSQLSVTDTQALMPPPAAPAPIGSNRPKQPAPPGTTVEAETSNNNKDLMPPVMSTPVALKRSSQPHLLPSPEVSPEGNYIGQHSQGLGGHYAESYASKKRKQM